MGFIIHKNDSLHKFEELHFHKVIVEDVTLANEFQALIWCLSKTAFQTPLDLTVSNGILAGIILKTRRCPTSLRCAYQTFLTLTRHLELHVNLQFDETNSALQPSPTLDMLTKAYQELSNSDCKRRNTRYKS